MDRPKIQILMAVFNGESYLSDQIKSIQSQTYSNWELLISDDGSTDGSLDIIKNAIDEDHRIRMVLDAKQYGSAKKHFMALTEIATSDYVMYCDQDDIWDKDKIEITLNEMLQAEKHHPHKPILVSTDLRVVDSNLGLLHPSFLRMSGMKSSKRDFGYFLSSCLVTGCTMMINRELRRIATRSVNIDKIIMHDWWLSLIASAFGYVYYIPKATISYRQHGDNSVGAEKRSIITALLSLKLMHDRMMLTIEQASEFYNCYNEQLVGKNRRQIISYLQLRDANAFQIIPCLTKANAWRDDWLGNLGMIIRFIV